MITEVLAGAALIKSSVAAIKSTIKTAEDVSQIATKIDQLFLGQSQVEKAKQDGNNLNSVAKEMIHDELSREAEQQVKLLVDMRFGSGTWMRIVEERSRRVRDAEKRHKAQIAKRKEQVEISIVLAAMFATIAAIIGGLTWYYIKIKP